jgi:hypothetical protein
MLFSYIAPIGAKSFMCCFFYKYSAPLELKIMILLGFYKKPTPENFSKGGIVNPLSIGFCKLMGKD